MNKFIKKELRKISKSNQSVGTMMRYIEIQFPSANPEEFRTYCKELLDKKMQTQLELPSYSGLILR